MQVSFVILNYNGREFLGECIPSVMGAIEVYGRACEVTIVDNGSSDDSVDYLKANFPQVRVLALEENSGFARAMNMGVRQAAHPLVVCLNNDTVVDANFIGPLTEHFIQEGDIFSVGSKMLFWDKQTLNFGRAKGDFKLGFFRRSIVDSLSSVNTLYACAGGFAVDRNKFLELGGFDEDMNVYWEDADLCYRAWKRGWRTIYEPGSIIYHKFHGTYSKKCGENGIQKMSGENYFLFILKNIHDRALFLQQLFLLPALMAACVLTGKPHFAGGILRSMKRWPLFLKKRRKEKEKALLSDREVFRISN